MSIHARPSFVYFPCNAKAAKSPDPYRNFSWETRNLFPNFEWDGRRDRNGRISGEGTVVFAHSGDEIGGFFRNGMREGHGWTATR